MTKYANSHPFKVAEVEDTGFYANSHPYQVAVVEGGGGKQEARIVSELPEVGEAGYLYLVLKETTSEGDVYDEYMWVLQEDGETYGWEHLGATNEVTIILYDSTGQNTDGAMTQLAASNMIYPSGDETDKANIAIGANATATYGSLAIGFGTTNNRKDVIAQSGGIAIGTGNATYRQNCIAGQGSVAIGAGRTYANGIGSVVIGSDASTIKASAVVLGMNSTTTEAYTVSVGSGRSGYADQYRRIVNVGNPTNSHDAATKDYTDNLAINYAALNDISAPTTSTEGRYIGQLYYDTTNEAMYFLKEIDTTTNPATYTWEAMGGGSGVEIINATDWSALWQ